MRESSKGKNKKYRYRPVTDKVAVTHGLRKSVIAVLSKTDNYKDLVGNSRVVSEIADAVFSSIYRKMGTAYYPRQDSNFGNMIESVIYNTSKIQQVHEAKSQIAKAAKVLSEGNTFSTTFEVLHASIGEKLDSESSKDLDFFESRFKKAVDEVVYAGSGESLKNLPPRKDLLYLDLILVAEGTNDNKDTIPAEELKKRYLTLIGMPLVEEHINDAIRGVFYDAKIVNIKPGKEKGSVKIVEKGGRTAVRAKAYVYKSRFPREAYILKDRQEKGLLRYSVELAFNQAECSACGQTFKPGDMYCEHLLLRHQKGMDFSRIVHDVYFIGGAYTTNPAEKGAVSIDVTDPADEESNKKVKSCVNTTDDTGKVDSEVKASKNEETVQTSEEDESPQTNDGGHRMYNFENVEELLASKEVNALVEARAADVISEEREAFAQSLTEMEEKLEASDTEKTALQETLDETKAELDKSNKVIAEMATKTRISEAILELQQAGYQFGSDDEIKAFSDKIATMDEEQAAFVIDLMKTNVTTASEETEGEPESKEEENKTEGTEEGNEEETLQASQNADTNASANEGGPVASIRKSWNERLEAIRNGD